MSRTESTSNPSGHSHSAQAADRGKLSPELVDLALHSSKQDSITEYPAVHAWWWVVFDEMMREMKAEGNDLWRTVDAGVAH